MDRDKATPSHDRRCTIYVGLLGEGLNVWRPIQADHIEADLYLIVDQAYDRVSESWECEPGERVRCRLVDSSDGQILAAVRRA